MTPATVSLAMLPTGAHALVHELRGRREVARRLSTMGLIAGVPVEMLQNRGSGPLLVRVRDTRIALGRGEALKILVQAAP